MKCPNCDYPGRLMTIETFQTPGMTYRTKICNGCKWKFTTHEAISDEMTIPQSVRKPEPVKEEA